MVGELLSELRAFLGKSPQQDNVGMVARRVS